MPPSCDGFCAVKLSFEGEDEGLSLVRVLTGRDGRFPFCDQTLRLIADRRHIEISPRTLRYFRLPMTKNAISGNVVFSHQINNEPNQRMQLLRRRPRIVEIADKTDADAARVIPVVERIIVSPPLLLGPARPDFNLPISAVRTVADDKMVPKLVKAAITMPFINDCSRSVRAVAVMDDDPGPMVGRNLRYPG